jgi:RNA polymerase sigma factor (sigma-70 family)
MNDLALILAAKCGDLAARNELVAQNIGLTQVALGRIPRRIDEYTGAAAIGLIRAIEKFDASKGSAFSTYAALWVRHFVWAQLRMETRQTQRCWQKNDWNELVDPTTSGDEQQPGLMKAMQHLTEEEAAVMSLKMQRHTCKKIGGLFGCSKQRIDQHLQSARRKIAARWSDCPASVRDKLRRGGRAVP